LIFKGEDDWGENLSIKFAELVKECPLVAVTQSYTGKSGLVEVTQSYTGKSHHWLQ
jgi:hypothetical protein